jgi:hypothetical protein
VCQQCASITTGDADALNEANSSGKFITIQSKERNDYLTGTLDNSDNLMAALEVMIDYSLDFQEESKTSLFTIKSFPGPIHPHPLPRARRC